MREAPLERRRVLEELNLLRGELDVQRLEVRLELLDLASADDGEDVRRLLHHVRNGNCKKNAASESDRVLHRRDWGCAVRQ